MQKITIHKLGPVNDCELEINDFTIFTGPQGSGKSTIAKSVFFFKNIKNILLAQFRKQWLLKNTLTEEELQFSLRKRTEREVRSNFLQIFGTTWYMDMSMSLTCIYKDGRSIAVSLKEDSLSPNYIWIEFSPDLTRFINSLEYRMPKEPAPIPQELLRDIKEKIDTFFDDDAETIYIPAGRSMITLLSTQLNYIYSSMDDTQKRNLDYCTQNYLERILQLKPSFALSIVQMIQSTLNLTDTRLNKQLLFSAAELMKRILQGEYRNVDGEERLLVSENRYVKINFASSGQQEAVWILNVIFYYLLSNKKAYFIIEEPESHLFPNAQKLITEFIAMAKNDGKNQIFITTHSPYILGTINNLLYAHRISRIVDKTELDKIIPKDTWIRFSKLSAFFVKDGQVISCTDDEFESIENEIIDEASADINRDFEQMVLLKEKCFVKEEK